MVFSVDSWKSHSPKCLKEIPVILLQVYYPHQISPYFIYLICQNFTISGLGGRQRNFVNKNNLTKPVVCVKNQVLVIKMFLKTLKTTIKNPNEIIKNEKSHNLETTCSKVTSYRLFAIYIIGESLVFSIYKWIFLKDNLIEYRQKSCFTVKQTQRQISIQILQ